MDSFIRKYGAFIISALVILGSGVILVMDSVTFASIPEYVWIVLSGFGFAVVRDAIDLVSQNDNRGWKTYVAAGAFVVLGVLQGIGISIPEEILDPILTMLSGIGVVGIRSALDKVAPGSLKI